MASSVSLTHGGLTSYSVGWITWVAVVTVAPIEVEAALQYATNYWSVGAASRNAVWAVGANGRITRLGGF